MIEPKKKSKIESVIIASYVLLIWIFTPLIVLSLLFHILEKAVVFPYEYMRKDLTKFMVERGLYTIIKYNPIQKNDK